MVRDAPRVVALECRRQSVEPLPMQEPAGLVATADERKTEVMKHLVPRRWQGIGGLIRPQALRGKGRPRLRFTQGVGPRVSPPLAEQAGIVIRQRRGEQNL